jgi:hypothetical protein
MRPSTGAFAIFDREGDLEVVVMLVDYEADAQSIAIELRKRGRRCRSRALPASLQRGRVQQTVQAVLPVAG